MKKFIVALTFFILSVISYGQVDTIPMGVGMKLNQAFPIVNVGLNRINDLIDSIAVLRALITGVVTESYPVYYVSAAGSDDSTGLTPATAWASIAKVNAATLTPGIGVLFNRDDTFIGRLNVPASGTAGSPITFGAYGTGANPVIDANAANTRCISISNKSYITIDGIDVKNATTGAGVYADSSSDYIVVKNLTVSDIGTTNANVLGMDLRGDNIIVTNCDITDIAAGGININGGGGNHKNITITYNDITLTNKYYSGNGAGAGILIYAGTDSTEIAYNTIHTNGGVGELHSVHGIYVGHGTTHQEVHHNTVTESSRGAGIKFAGDGSVHHNYIATSFNGGIQLGGNYPGVWDVTQTVYNNICTGNGKGIWENNGNRDDGVLTIYIYNNTLYNDNNTANEIYTDEIKVDDDVEFLTIKNNIVYAPTGRYAYAIVAQTHATINNNCIYTSGNPAYYNGGARTWATWQGYGFDAQGVNADPLMVNPPTSFLLQAGSPCINAGASGAGIPTTDYAGNARVGATDIGAYEKQP